MTEKRTSQYQATIKREVTLPSLTTFMSAPCSKNPVYDTYVAPMLTFRVSPCGR